MKVDPYIRQETKTVYILCLDGDVVLHDDRRTPAGALRDPSSAFQQMLSELDPNRAFIVACVPKTADQKVFFQSREVAGERNLHVQASLDTEEALLQIWDSYKRTQAMANVESEEGGDGESSS